MKIDVLDHGFVRLVSYMQPAPDPEGELERLKTEKEYNYREEQNKKARWTGDLEIVRNARVSYDADWRTGEEDGKDAGLLGYMYKNHHTSPFEAMVFTFEIKCPLFVARQWHRHRTWSYNEVSARYSEVPDDYYVPNPEQITTQSKDNKQMRTTDKHHLAEPMSTRIGSQSEESYRQYKLLIDSGCPRELARSVLPTGMYTRFFGTVDLHNLIHFLRLRTHEHAQWEIQQYAHALAQLIEPVVPVTATLIREDFLKT